MFVRTNIIGEMVPNRLLDTAVDQFGRFGFDGASTRAIAKASGTAMSSITYHFGGKKGLYLAAADHIAGSLSELHKPILAKIDPSLAGGQEAGREALLLLIDHFARIMLSPESEPWARFIIREQQEPTDAFDRLFQGAMAPIVRMLIALMAKVRPDLDPREARATAILLIGQAMILRAGRTAVCRILGVDRIDEETGALLRARLRDNLLCILKEKG